MINDKKRLVALVFALDLIAIAIAIQIFVLVKEGGALSADRTLNILLAVPNIIALVLSGIYTFTGFKKSSSLFFKLFIFSFLLVLMVYTIAILPQSFSTVPMNISLVVTYGLLCVFAFAKDLGKKTSLLFVYLILAGILAFIVFHTISNLSLAESAARTELVSMMLLRETSLLILSVILVGIVYMKYYDKELRKSK